jgi:iron complex outermembrane receptor protein
VARALGATTLEAEQSVHYSGGLVWTPVDGLDLTVDAYRIDIDGRVVFSGNFTGARILPLIQSFGATGARFFTNAVDTETKGLDLTATWRRQMGEGSLTLSAAYNRNDTDVVGAIATPPVLAGLENVLFDREQTQRLTCAQPKDNLRLSGDWQKGRWGAVVRGSRYGEYCYPTNVVANDQIFGAEWVADLELAYRMERLTVALGAQNVFDAFPDLLRSVNSSFGVQTFPSISPFGFNGRFLYGRITLRL